MLQQTQIVIYLLDLLLDQNEQIRRVSSLCLDAVAEADDQWASQIRQRKFQMHNHQWLELVDEDEAEEYQDAVALNNAMQSLHLNAPLDASQLEPDDYSFEPPSPLTPLEGDSLGDASPAMLAAAQYSAALNDSYAAGGYGGYSPEQDEYGGAGYGFASPAGFVPPSDGNYGAEQYMCGGVGAESQAQMGYGAGAYGGQLSYGYDDGYGQ